MAAHDSQRVQQAAVLGRRLDVHQVEQPEQQDAMIGVDRPQQGQVVAPMPGGHCFALLGQRRGATLCRQELSDLAPKCSIRGLSLLGFQHLAEDANQVFLDRPVLVMERIEFFLGCGLCPSDPPQHQLDEFVSSAHTNLAQQGEQQGMPLAGQDDVEEVADLQCSRLRGELAQFGMGDALQ